MLYCLIAATTPNTVPRKVPTTMAATVSSIVGQKREPITSKTGLLLMYE